MVHDWFSRLMPEVVQNSSNIHHPVPGLIFPKLDFVLTDFQPFHPCKCMLDSDSDPTDAPVDALLQVPNLSVPGFFIG